MADSNIKIGVSTEGVAKAKTELNSVKASGEQVIANNEKLVRSNDKVNNSFKGGAGNIRNSAYQLQDLAVQIQGGTSVTTALSQQLPQLLSGFGLLGVVAGAAAAGLGLLISATDIFSSKTDRLVKQQKTTIESLKQTVDLIDQFSQGTKLLTTTSADAFEQWLASFRKANEEGKKELLDFLRLQKIINDAAIEQSDKQIANMKERRQNLSALNKQMGLPETLGFGMPFSPITDTALADAELKQKKLLDFQRRTDAALRGDFGTATQGGSARTSMQTTMDQKIQALKVEAQYIGVSNAEREYGVMLAELEAQAKRANTTLNKQELVLLKQLVMERDSARSVQKLNEYVIAQQSAIDIVKLEGQAVGMSARQHKQLVDARNLEMQIAKETQGMQQKDAQAYADTARSLFLVKQALEDVNYANSRAFGTGATNAIKDYMKGLGDAAKDANNLFSNAFKGMEDAMVDAFSTGKLSFKSMIDTMMADITRLIIRQALLKPLYQSMGLTEGGGGFNVGSLFSAGASLFGNVGTAANYGTSVGSQQTAMLAAQDAGLPFFADGTNNIPYDNYPAILHKGEAVVPAKYNPAVGGMGTGNITYSPTINIDSRTDAGEVRALVGRAVQQGQYELVDKINRGQVRIRT
jgi:lambda family phage tail tape measure protein